MNPTRLYTGLLLIVVIAHTFACASSEPEGSLPRVATVDSCRQATDAMRVAIDDVNDRQRNVGLAVLVLLNGEVVLNENRGFADLEHRVPVGPKTRFGVASITKAFTGLALLKVHEQGKLDFDAPIQRYVPQFPEKPEGTITPRLLASHLGGIRHWADDRTPELYAKHFDDVADILDLFKDDPLVAAPGTEYRYSSHGYNLLAAAIQGAAKQPFQSYVAEQILEPLGLSHTTFDDVRRVLPDRARRYSFYEPTTFAEDSESVYVVPRWDYSHNMGGGNMASTTEDLARFGRALMSPGLLDEESLELLYARSTDTAADSPWSFGWFVRNTEGRRRIHITGANPGLQAGIHVYPDEDLVTVVLSNAWGIGSNSAELVTTLPESLAALCLRWETSTTMGETP